MTILRKNAPRSLRNGLAALSIGATLFALSAVPVIAADSPETNSSGQGCGPEVSAAAHSSTNHGVENHGASVSSVARACAHGQGQGNTQGGQDEDQQGQDDQQQGGNQGQHGQQGQHGNQAKHGNQGQQQDDEDQDDQQQGGQQGQQGQHGNQGQQGQGHKPKH
jgi:hypothetical protein